MNKKGLSAVVASLLIVLITIAAVLLVWNVVKKNITDTGSQLSKADCIKVDVKVDSCTTAGVVVLSYNGGNVSKIVVTLENAAAVNNATTLASPDFLGSKKTITIEGVSAATKASATAFLKGGDGAEIACGVVSETTCA